MKNLNADTFGWKLKSKHTGRTKKNFSMGPSNANYHLIKTFLKTFTKVHKASAAL